MTNKHKIISIEGLERIADMPFAPCEGIAKVELDGALREIRFVVSFNHDYDIVNGNVVFKPRQGISYDGCGMWQINTPVATITTQKYNGNIERAIENYFIGLYNSQKLMLEQERQTLEALDPSKGDLRLVSWD